MARTGGSAIARRVSWRMRPGSCWGRIGGGVSPLRPLIDPPARADVADAAAGGRVPQRAVGLVSRACSKAVTAAWWPARSRRDLVVGALWAGASMHPDADPAAVLPLSPTPILPPLPRPSATPTASRPRRRRTPRSCPAACLGHHLRTPLPLWPRRNNPVTFWPPGNRASLWTGSGGRMVVGGTAGRVGVLLGVQRHRRQPVPHPPVGGRGDLTPGNGSR
jgi:hypothetical protein